MKIEKIDINLLNPSPYNPRKDLKPGDKEYEKIRKSIKSFDLVEPLIWNKRTGNLVGGHQRLKVMRDEMNVTEVDVSVVDLDEKKEKALNLALNKISGDWNMGSLKEMLVELDDGDFDLNLTGFDEIELKDLIDYEGKKGLTDEDEVPPTPEEPTTKLGDIYELGPHRIMCGDSTKMDDVEMLMDNQAKVDLVVTDPPYNLAYDFNNNGMVQTGQRKARFSGIKNDNMSENEFEDFIGRTFKNMGAFLKSGGSYYLTGGRESTQVFNRILKTTGFYISQWLVWVKENFNISRLGYHPKHEIITYGWKSDGKHSWYSNRSQVDVLNFSRNIGKSVHPTEKPVGLLAYLIQNSSKSGDYVLDLFLGSGSTLIAAEKTERICYGMEIDPKYCDVIVKRWEDYTGKKAQLKNREITHGKALISER